MGLWLIRARPCTKLIRRGTCQRTTEVTYPRRRPLRRWFHGLHNLVLLNVSDLGPEPELLENALGEASGIAVDVAVVDPLNAGGDVADERVLSMELLEEVQVVRLDVRVHVVLENDDVRVVQGAMGMLAGKEGRECDGGAGWGRVRGRERGGKDESGRGDGDQGPLCERRHRGWESGETPADPS